MSNICYKNILKKYFFPKHILTTSFQFVFMFYRFDFLAFRKFNQIILLNYTRIKKKKQE